MARRRPISPALAQVPGPHDFHLQRRPRPSARCVARVGVAEVAVAAVAVVLPPCAALLGGLAAAPRSMDCSYGRSAVAPSHSPMARRTSAWPGRSQPRRGRCGRQAPSSPSSAAWSQSSIVPDGSTSRIRVPSRWGAGLAALFFSDPFGIRDVQPNRGAEAPVHSTRTYRHGALGWNSLDHAEQRRNLQRSRVRQRHGCSSLVGAPRRCRFSRTTRAQRYS